MEAYSDKRSAIHNPHWKSDGSIEKHGSGYKIGVKALNIIWGNDSRFWQFIQLSNEDTSLIGFKEGAVLLQVNWIEVTGKIAIKTITSEFRNKNSERKMKITYWIRFRDDAFGWHSVEIKFKVKHIGKDAVTSSCNHELFREKNDDKKWHEINGGNFTVDDEDGILEFGMYEIESDWWKGGIILGGIDIQPVL